MRRLWRGTLADSSGVTRLIESAVFKSIHTLDEARTTHILSGMLLSTHVVNEYLSILTKRTQFS